MATNQHNDVGLKCIWLTPHPNAIWNIFKIESSSFSSAQTLSFIDRIRPRFILLRTCNQEHSGLVSATTPLTSITGRTVNDSWTFSSTSSNFRCTQHNIAFNTTFSASPAYVNNTAITLFRMHLPISKSLLVYIWLSDLHRGIKI